MIKNKKLYFKTLIHIIDVCIIVLTLICLFIYAERSTLVGKFLQKLESASHAQFINYFHLFHTESVFTAVTALLVFVSTLRLWKLLRFTLIIKTVEKTVLFSAKPLLYVFLWQLLILLSYGIAGLIFFGQESEGFRNLNISMITLLMKSLGFDESFKTDSFKSSLHFFYYISFLLINLLIYTLCIAIITISYYNAQVCLSNIKEYNVIDYLKEKAYFYLHLIKVKIGNFRLSGGTDVIEEKLIYPKLDEHRFAKCITQSKNRMGCMVLVTLCILRSCKKKSTALSVADMELIKNTIVGLFQDEGLDNILFYISNLQGFEKTLVDDLVFVKMEKVVEHILSTSQKKKKDRVKELYGKICHSQEMKMEGMKENLSLLSRVISNIDLND